MKQETLDYIISSITLTTIISTYIFWLASRQIKDQLINKLAKLSYDLAKKQESDMMATDHKMQRWQDASKIRSITLEYRIASIEERLNISGSNIIESIERQLGDIE